MLENSSPSSPAKKLATLSALAGAFVALLGVVKVFGAVGGVSVDPSQSARIVAEGTGDAVRWLVFGIALCVASIVVLLVLRRRGTDSAPPR